MDNQLVIKTDVLKEVCGKILTAVDTSELSVITETLELATKDNYLVIGVTNREYFAEVKLEMAEDCNFRAAVPANLFLKLISQITSEDIQLNVTENALLIRGNGNYKVTLATDSNGMVTLPRIDIQNVTAEFPISADILNSILQFNSKEFTKGTISNPIQKLYYVDEYGAVTFTSGACVNSFTLSQPVKLLMNNRLVKLFKLFKGGDVKFTLGHDKLSDNIIQTKVKFEDDSVAITAILSCDDALMSKFPVTAVRSRATKEYPYSISLNKTELVQTINRLTLFNSTTNAVAKTYGVFEFGPSEVTVYDANKANKEVLKYSNTEQVPGLTTYTMYMNLDDFKATLDSCAETHVNIHFGDDKAIMIPRGNIRNIVPQTIVS